MRKACFLSVAALACAGLAHAQGADSWLSPSCADVERGSLEAELLDCDRAVPPVPLPDVEVSEDLPPPEAEEAPEPAVVIEVAPEPLPDADAAPESVVVVEEAPEVEPEPLPDPEVVVIEERDEYPSDAATSEDWIEAHPVEDAVEPAEEGADEDSREEERAEEDRREDDEAGEDAQALRIPNGHRPPPGSCRVWFPDRPPGHQPPPGSCDVEVPQGAVLIRG